MYQSVIKRVLDAMSAILALIVLLVPMILIAGWVKLDSRGPALFKQLRSGKDKRPFTVYKFRTMSIDAPKDSPTTDFKDSGNYITRSGKIMRKLSLDELPQFFNVLRGDMSLIGPRPVVLKETKLLELRDELNVNRIKPGITGWAQVNGRDTMGDTVKAQHDAHYANNIGIVIDIICVIKTVWAVISVKGHQEGHEQSKSDKLMISEG